MSCADLEAVLRALGFRVRDGRRGGHKLFTRPGLVGFHGGSFNGGTNPIRPCYVVTVIRTINLYREDLKTLLEKGK